MTMTMTTATEPVIRVAGLHKRYGDTRAVDGVSFEVSSAPAASIAPSPMWQSSIATEPMPTKARSACLGSMPLRMPMP